MFLILLGAPGSGKGTISEMLKERNDFNHISSGVAFREIINTKSNKNEIKKLQKTLSSGQLVDDKTVFEVIKAKLSEYDIHQDNIILDGVPRTIAQASLLADYIQNRDIQNVYFIYFKTTKTIIMDRVGGRLTCPKCGKVYHNVHMPPKKLGYCDDDGTELIRRPDDEKEKLIIRLKEYEDKTMPLLDFYDNLLIKIDATKDSETMYQELMKKLGLENDTKK